MNASFTVAPTPTISAIMRECLVDTIMGSFLLLRSLFATFTMVSASASDTPAFRERTLVSTSGGR